MGRQLARLVEARSTASPWQTMAVDRMTPLLKELASNTSAVIDDLNESPHRLHADDYKEYLESDVSIQTEPPIMRWVGQWSTFGPRNN